MSNNIYDKLNDIDFNLEDYEIENLSEMEKKKMKKDFKRANDKKNKNKFIYMAGAVGLGIILLNTNFGQQVYGKAESKISDIGYGISQALGINKNLDEYASVINKTIDENGIEIKLNEVVLDKDEMVVSILVDSGKDVRSFILDDEIKINGKRIRTNSASGSMEKLDDSVFGSLSSISIEDISSDEELDVEYNIKSILLIDENMQETIKGPWKFAFKSNSAELMKDSKSYEIEESVDIEGTDFTFDNLYVTGLGSKIYGTRNTNKAYDIELIGLDSKGRDVKYYASSMEGEKVIYKPAGQVDFSDVEYIDFKVVYREYPEESGRIRGELKQTKEGFTIRLK